MFYWKFFECNIILLLKSEYLTKKYSCTIVQTNTHKAYFPVRPSSISLEKYSLFYCSIRVGLLRDSKRFSYICTEGCKGRRGWIIYDKFSPVRKFGSKIRIEMENMAQMTFNSDFEVVKICRWRWLMKRKPKLICFSCGKYIRFYKCLISPYNKN